MQIWWIRRPIEVHGMGEPCRSTGDENHYGGIGDGDLTKCKEPKEAIGNDSY